MNTFNEFIQAMPEKYGNAVACQYIKGGEVVKVSFNRLTQDVNRMSRFLISCGIQGKNVGILGRNSYPWVVCYLAIANINSVSVLLNPETSEEEQKGLVLKADVEMLLCDTDWQKMFQNNFAYTMEQAMEEASAFTGSPLPLEYSAEKLATICFTSGTTRKQKGVMLSQKCLLSACNCLENSEAGNNEIRSMLVVPLYHIKGLAGMLLSLNGITLCINSSIKYFYRELRRFSPQFLDIVPLMLETMSKELHKRNFERSSLGNNLETIYCGGAKMNTDTAKSFQKVGIQVIQAYGMTEMCGGIALNTPDSGKPDSAGKIFPWVQVKIVDGEITVKSEYTMLGYYKDEEETQEILKDGWLYTGDLGYVDEDGFLYITGRKKNLIILSSGENVSPEELEGKLKACPLIQEIQVYEENEKICAEIFAEQDEVAQLKIRDFIMKWNTTVPMFKQIRTVKFRNTEFEKTESGKIKRG